MIKVTIERDGWHDYKENAWGGAISTLKDVEKQGREYEAMDIIEYYFSEDRLGYIPSDTEVNNFIWGSLPDIMHLYDEDDEEKEADDEEKEADDEEYEKDEEE